MRVLTVLTACVLLTACNQGPKTDPKAKAAGGEVLPGTVSDAMIDLDRSTAEPPLVPHKAVAADASDTAKDKKSAAPSSVAGEEEPAAKPTAETKSAAKPAD